MTQARKSPYGSAREALVSAARRLLWERGYGAMSPKAVLKASGAGQGSLYHHFTGKADLARAALAEVAERLIEGMERQADPRLPPLEQIERYLTAPRDALKGCRLGRLASESDVVTSDIQKAIEPYFVHLETTLVDLLAQAVSRDDLPGTLNPKDLAATLAAVVQGGYVLSQARQDPDQMTRATRGALALLDGAR